MAAVLNPQLADRHNAFRDDRRHVHASCPLRGRLEDLAINELFRGHLKGNELDHIFLLAYVASVPKL